MNANIFHDMIFFSFNLFLALIFSFSFPTRLMEIFLYHIIFNSHVTSQTIENLSNIIIN